DKITTTPVTPTTPGRGSSGRSWTTNSWSSESGRRGRVGGTASSGGGGGRKVTTNRVRCPAGSPRTSHRPRVMSDPRREGKTRLRASQRPRESYPNRRRSTLDVSSAFELKTVMLPGAPGVLAEIDRAPQWAATGSGLFLTTRIFVSAVNVRVAT